jgi:hypothetical protein
MSVRQTEEASLDLAQRLGDDELIERLQHLLRQDRALSARLLVHLGEVDARGLYREHAYSSMFEYAVEALHMSESEAYTRIRAARVSRDFPAVLAMIASGELHLSAVKLLAPVLTAENCAELLAAARFKSKRQVESMLAQRLPKPDVPSVIRRLPAKASDQQQSTLAVTAKPLLATPSPETNQRAGRQCTRHRSEPGTHASARIALRAGISRSAEPR